MKPLHKNQLQNINNSFKQCKETSHELNSKYTLGLSKKKRDEIKKRQDKRGKRNRKIYNKDNRSLFFVIGQASIDVPHI